MAPSDESLHHLNSYFRRYDPLTGQILRFGETRRKWNHLSQSILYILRHAFQHWGFHNAGAMVMTRIASRASSRASGSVIATTAPLDAE